MKQQTVTQTREQKTTVPQPMSSILQRRATRQVEPSIAPSIVHEVLRSSGCPLDNKTRAFMEPRFGHDFSQVRVHTDDKAAESARAVNARAYTVGQHVVMQQEEYAPATDAGRRLLAHELVHVVQQGGNRLQRKLQVGASGDVYEQEAERVADRVVRISPQPTDERWLTHPTLAARNALRIRHGVWIETVRPSVADSTIIQRKAKAIGTKVTHPMGSKSPYKSITANFDGQDFTVMGDKKEILKVSAQSGRPITVRATDAKSCGGSTSDSYMNNPRYVGIADNGPIPEGEYRFSLTQMATFSFLEQKEMILGGEYTDPFGVNLHGGDWGAGRVPLTPVTILPSKCGNTRTRSGFYLHGGSLPGSSGCIDIGNDGINQLIPLLYGYKSSLKVTVKYKYLAPSVSAATRALGRFTYPSKKDPGVWDRIKSVFDDN